MLDKPIEKTNAMRLLDQRHIDYEAYAYDPAIHVATEVAPVIGFSPDEVYKTLVVLPEAAAERRRPLLVMIASNREMDSRLLARGIGAKSVRMAPRVEAERLTGLQVGGIGALALIGKGFGVYLDAVALEHEHILVNGGRRGLNLRLRVADLLAVTGARPVVATAP
jgi:Cys-tRNA(Pro)/Cys-tRNA(Cys) deacylase